MKFTVAVCMALLAVMLVQAKEEVAPPSLPAATRIVNGRPAAPRQFPYMAYIEAFTDDGSVYYRCAGSLIARSAVLTSVAFCVSSSATKWTVRLGSIYRTGDDPHAWTVESVMAMRHPKYDYSSEDNNIGIIQLPKLAPVNDFIQPVHLPSSPADSSYIGRQAIVAGWGYTAPDSGPSDVLRWARVLVVRNEYCKQFAAVTERQLCAGSSTTTVWEWDYGAPLVLNIRGRYTQIGVFSRLTTIDINTSHPVIYNRVTPYIDWIKLYTESD